MHQNLKKIYYTEKKQINKRNHFKWLNIIKKTLYIYLAKIQKNSYGKKLIRILFDVIDISKLVLSRYI